MFDWVLNAPLHIYFRQTTVRQCAKNEAFH